MSKASAKPSKKIAKIANKAKKANAANAKPVGPSRLEPLEARTFFSGQPTIDIDAYTATGRVELPDAVISGSGVEGEFPIWIKNMGEEPIGARGEVNVQVFARFFDSLNEKYDTPIGKAEGIQIGRKLKPGQSIMIKAPIKFPMGLQTEDYVFNARVEAANFHERNAHNNKAFIDRTHEVAVTTGEFELDATITESSYARYVIDGVGRRGYVDLDIASSGTLRVPRSYTADIQVVARPVGASDTSEDVVLTTMEDRRFYGVELGESRQITARFVFPDGMDTGAYEIVAIVDPENTIPEGNDDNRHVSERWLLVDDKRIDLEGEIPTLELPELSLTQQNGYSSETISIPVDLRNTGNARFNPDQTVDVAIWANRIPRLESPDPVEWSYSGAVEQFRVGVVSDVAIGNLRPGDQTTQNVDVRFHKFMLQGDWRITAFVDASRELAEADESNNGGVTDEFALVDHDITFETDERSMWGVDADAVMDTGYLFKGVEWNKSAETGKLTLPFNAASAQLYGNTNGRVGVDFRAILDSGSVDVDYANQVQLRVLDGGTDDGYTIDTRIIGDAGGKLVTRSPQVDIESNLIFDVYARAGVKGHAFGNNYNEGTTLINVDERFKLLKVNSSEITVMGETLAEADPGERLKLEIDMGIDYSTVKPKPKPKVVENESDRAKKKNKKADGKKQKSGITLSAGDITLYSPELNLTEREYRGWAGSAGQITAAGSTDLAKLDLDIDFLFTALFPPVPPLGASFEAGPVNVRADLIDVDLGPVFALAQTFKFEPEPRTVVNFEEDVQVWSGSGWTTTDTASAPVGEQIHFRHPDPNISFTTTYELDNSFRSQTDLTVALQGELKILDVYAELFGHTLADFTVYSKALRTGAAKLATVFDQTYELGGFQPMTTDPVTLELSKRDDTKITFTNPNPAAYITTLSDGPDLTSAPGETGNAFPG